MSIKYMTCVWEKSKQTGTNLLLLLALADHANDAGVCWPGIPHLARKVRRSERQTKRLIQQLIASGELEVAEGGGRGHTNLYKILLDPHGNGDADDTISDEKKVTPVTKKVTSGTQKVTPVTKKGDTAMSPESSLTIKEPSENLSPPLAESSSKPNLLPPTENPDSITNRPLDSGEECQGGNGSTGDYGGDLLRHSEAGPSFTVPSEAGGADAFADGPLEAFCQLVKTRSDLLSEKKRRQWAKKLREIAGEHGIDAAEMTTCIGLLPESDWAWRVKGLTKPYEGGFDGVIGALILRRLSGEPILTDDGKDSSSGQSRENRSQHRRGRHRREYEPCTDAERQAMWDLHGKWMKALMARKREEIDPRIDASRFRSVIGQQLGLDERQAQALCEAFEVWEAETAEPLNIEALLGESD